MTEDEIKQIETDEDEEIVTDDPVEEEEPVDDEEPQDEPETPSEDGVTGKLASETNNEVKEDVEWTKKSIKNKIVDDPDSFRERWRRARLLRHGHVILRTLSRDPDTGDVIKESTIVRFEDLPRGAVECTNEKKVFCLDKIKTSQWYQKTREDLNFNPYEAQFTASDAYLWMTNNKVDNALITNWTDFNHIDKKKIALIGGIAAMAVILMIIWIL